jgi:ketosteroid isomerase-like protein
MNTEENRRTALKFVESMSAGQMDLSLLTDDVQWWAPGRGLLSKTEFFALAAGFTALVKDKISLKIHGVTADGDRVAVEAESYGELKNGKIYNNTYHFLFLFRDGKIYLSKEYNDSHHAATVMAP